MGTRNAARRIMRQMSASERQLMTAMARVETTMQRLTTADAAREPERVRALAGEVDKRLARVEAILAANPALAAKVDTGDALADAKQTAAAMAGRTGDLLSSEPKR